MIVTTSIRGQGRLAEQGRRVAEELEQPFVKRERYSFPELLQIYETSQILLVGADGLKLYDKQDLEQPFFFHPGSAMFRIKRLLADQHDPMVEAVQMRPGLSFLDCTLGMGADAIVAAHVAGETGEVVGLESEREIAYLVSEGLRHRLTEHQELNQAMRRIKVKHIHHAEYLRLQPSRSFDVVYFDPMFEQTVARSSGLAPIKKIANYDSLDLQTIEEAKRVAKQRVILKDSSYSHRFKQLGFQPFPRKYASHWFGIIEVGK